MIKSFGSMGVELKELLENFILFLKALMPSYFLAVTASSGSATAMIFYEAVLFLIYVIQVVFLKGIVPAIYVFGTCRTGQLSSQRRFLIQNGRAVADFD